MVTVIRVPYPRHWSGVEPCGYDYELPHRACPRPGFEAERALGLMAIMGFVTTGSSEAIRLQMIPTDTLELPPNNAGGGRDGLSALGMVSDGQADFFSMSIPIYGPRLAGNLSYVPLTKTEKLAYIFHQSANSKSVMTLVELCVSPLGYWFIIIVLGILFKAVKYAMNRFDRRYPDLLFMKTKMLNALELLIGLVFAVILSGLASYLFAIFTRERVSTLPINSLSELAEALDDGDYVAITQEKYLYDTLLNPPEEGERQTGLLNRFKEIKSSDPGSSKWDTSGILSLFNYRIDPTHAKQKTLLIGQPVWVKILEKERCDVVYSVDASYVSGPSGIFWNNGFKFPKMSLSRGDIAVYEDLTDKLLAKYYPHNLWCTDGSERPPEDAADLLVLNFAQLQGVFTLTALLSGLCAGALVIEGYAHWFWRKKGRELANEVTDFVQDKMDDLTTTNQRPVKRRHRTTNNDEKIKMKNTTTMYVY